jgi:hypothetical protein
VGATDPTFHGNVSEAAWIGSYKNRKDEPLEIAWSNQPLRFLGVFISYDENLCKKRNFDDRLEKCKLILNSRKERNLTLTGRAQGPVPETALSQRYLLAWRYLQFSATLKLTWR